MPEVDIPQSICRAGVARRDITPPAGIYHRMWGAATHDRASGVHRPLTATALALSPADSRDSAAVHVVVAVDHCLLWNNDMEALLSRAARVASLRSQQIHVAFSHTHAAGLMDPRRADLPGGELIAPYLAKLAEDIGQAAAEAVQKLADATIVYGQGRSSLAHNRDFWDDRSGQFVCGLNPAGASDDTLILARISSNDDHRRLATVVNYACHPTTLAWDNTLVSPDYVGALREVVESATGAPSLFLQGASGDLGPQEGYVGDAAVADRNGRQLGYAALATLESLAPPGTMFEYSGPVVSGATIGTWQHRAISPAESDAKRRWTQRELEINLPYRDDLPSPAETEVARASWQGEEQTAIARGDASAARD
jgi:hypothetical protein